MLKQECKNSRIFQSTLWKEQHQWSKPIAHAICTFFNLTSRSNTDSPRFLQPLCGFRPQNTETSGALLTLISLCLCVCLSVYLSVCLSICLPVCLSIYLSIYLFMQENGKISVIYFEPSREHKRWSGGIAPHILNLGTSSTWVVSLTQLYPQGTVPIPTGWVGPRPDLKSDVYTPAWDWTPISRSLSP